MTVCARSAVMLDRDISKRVDILQGVAQGCTLSPNLRKIYINDLIVAVEAARQGAIVGLIQFRDCVCGWLRGEIRNTRNGG